MADRILVEYTQGTGIEGRRLLDPSTGRLYHLDDTAREANTGFHKQPGGLWKNRCGSVVREVFEAPVTEPVTDRDECKSTYCECDGVERETCSVRLSTSPHPQAYKADDGKPNWFLLMSQEGCAKALAGVVRVLSFAVRPVAQGGKGYVKHSWRQVPEAKERYEAALYRHLSKVSLGEELDDESGESHWYHIATNALFLAELHNEGKSQ